MAVVHFYEKPGCFNNKLQKQLLLDKGHVVFSYNLLQHPWRDEPEKLRSFFGDLPVAKWFNRSASAIKNGEVVPEQLNAQQAIALMTDDPLLIRRPLLEVDGRRRAGFDPETIEAWLHVDIGGRDMETCVKQPSSSACQS